MQNSVPAQEHRNYKAPVNLLNEKVILITGSSDGIGRTIAITYASHGATIILHGRDIARLEKVYDEIVEAGGKQPAIIPLDLSKATTHDYQQLSKMIQSEFGQLNGIVHNAAGINELTPVEFIDPTEWLNLMQINVNAVHLITQSCLPLLKQSTNPSVITTSSSVGRIGRAYWGAYAVSKFAVEGYTQVLADEYENTGVRINAINPGATRTKMRATAYPAEDKSKLTDAATLMPSYLYLMGEDSIHINGASINAQ
ncbi:MAG: YciK family oxidoreductase [Kangiellaceae bacterium]